MKEKDLKHRLQQTFDFSIWKEILPLFFKKIDYFSSPENLSRPEIGLHKNVNLWELEFMKTKRA